MSHLFKKSLLMLAWVVTFAVSQSGTAVGQLDVQAVVDIGTGEIILELAGTGTQVIGIELREGPSFLDAFDINAFDATTGLGPAGQLGSNGIGFLGLIPFPAGTFNLGAILDEPFRSQEQVERLEISFGQAGSPAQFITVANGGITVINSAIPEPGSLSLFALASLSIVARRRR